MTGSLRHKLGFPWGVELVPTVSQTCLGSFSVSLRLRMHGDGFSSLWAWDCKPYYQWSEVHHQAGDSLSIRPVLTGCQASLQRCRSAAVAVDASRLLQGQRLQCGYSTIVPWGKHFYSNIPLIGDVWHMYADITERRSLVLITRLIWLYKSCRPPVQQTLPPQVGFNLVKV